jgi:hypothetical protein
MSLSRSLSLMVRKSWSLATGSGPTRLSDSRTGLEENSSKKCCRSEDDQCAVFASTRSRLDWMREPRRSMSWRESSAFII